MNRIRILICLPLVIFTCMSVVFFSSCLPKIKQQTGYMEEAEIDIGAYELRLRMNEFANSFAGIVEFSADQIISDSDDPQIDRKALLWKMRAIPAGFKAAFAPDPLLALIDSWVLCKQMVIYFEEGPGKNSFGKWQYIAIDASKKLESEVKEIAKRSAEKIKVSEADKEFDAWARENPIESPLFVRKSALDFEAEFLGKEKFDLARSFQTVNEGMNDLRNRMSVYTEYLPKPHFSF